MKNDNYKQPVIYIVDDDEDDLFFIKSSVLNNIPGCTVKCFTNGKLLVDCLKSGKENLPVFIIMDLNMPVLNGKETMMHLRDHKLASNTPVVIFSTSNNPHEKKTCLEYGAKAYYSKPASVHVYDEIIQGLRNKYLDQMAVS